MDVPVTVKVREDAPSESLDGWDHVAECSINVPSGRIVISGCTDYFPDAARIDVQPASYRARILYGGLDTLSDDGLDGSDHYEIVLWPSSPANLVVLKQWKKVGS